jgi:Leucine-rich repeat (LRR) protein
MKNLESACLAECSLKSLKNLPDWPKLTDLDISSNALKDEEFKNLKKYPNLVRLNVADNQIQTFDPISTFANMKNLEELDCADNKIEENKDYRKKIYDTIKHLIILDHMDKDGKTVDDEDYEDEEGEG